MDESFNLVIKKLIVNEGGYTDGKNQVKDMPTNMGIQQSTLDFYNKLKPGKNFPKDVKNLQLNQAIEIYKDLYWDNTKIPEIRNTRLKFAIFDMNVMGGAGFVLQKSLNAYLDSKLVVDGVIGSMTIDAVNSISDDHVDDFMKVLKFVRIEYLKNTPNWPTACNGWLQRTNAY